MPNGSGRINTQVPVINTLLLFYPTNHNTNNWQVKSPTSSLNLMSFRDWLAACIAEAVCL
ncbi:uncharacterized protein LACBIDRAFT_302787 [Laccaria bicolor S238N-H82]|uniref:Predicted protein n=1 Tax=Laccaria bicolor (strain S238N-H82 / ATCC MYA-4686) TaxID=486041 RepID=B0DIA9_LACBS|nr:uncharacterized protein LACBIDRAFT_302787 [Laccaria bicolor S238N-H82]EDR05653.1 predicted protein [Laccaria bicolor S238N-H82]|eukprot:XP_001883757.1 predicted protein [Laccaria bicolor S238N-H82]